MSALDQLSSVDRALAEMRRQFEDEKQTIRDECRIATIERDLLREQLATSQANCAKWQRIATQFVTQFDTVRRICEDVAQAAINVQEIQRQEEYTADQDAGNANAMASDDGGADICPVTQPCPNCGAKWGFEHAPTCPIVAGVNDDPVPEFLRNGQDNLTEPADNAKLDPDFTQPVDYAPGKASSRLLRRPKPIEDQ